MILFFILLFLPWQSQSETDGRTAVLNYMNHLAKEGGGYGWEDQPDAHLTPTFAAIGVFYHLNELPGETGELSEFVRKLHPQRTPFNREAGNSGTELRDLVYQQVQALQWLGADAAEFEAEVSGWESQAGKTSNFERNGYPVFMQEMMRPVVGGLLEMEPDMRILDYIMDHRRTNGSFNNAPAEDGGDGNVLNTWWGLYALHTMGHPMESSDETIAWLRASQTATGGFTHQPDPQIGINEEVAYTRAAIRALDLLGAQPADRDGAIRYLLSLQNSDGGFGNRPGLPSTPMATYYAVDGLRTLGALSALESQAIKKPGDKKVTPDFTGYNIYTVQFQAPGSGSPQEAVMLADSLNIDLWGAKNTDAAWIEAARKIAAEKNVKVEFFHANEDYGKHVEVEGMGSFNHLFDPIFPVERNYVSPRWSLRQPYYFEWDSFRSDYVDPLLNDQGALLWQVSHNEPLARLLLDDAVNNGGFAGVSTIHFNQNFLFWLPYLYQYRHQLSFIALQDFHGSESWWWTGELVHSRNLFLAKEPTYEAMLQALKEGKIAAVRHDEITGYKTRMLGGAPGVQEYLTARQDEWKWWGDNPGDPGGLIHPWAAVSVLGTDDAFEKGIPESGVNIRIRNRHGGQRERVGEPLVRLIALRVNGEVVYPEYVEFKNPQGRLTDAYYLYSWPDISPGNHDIAVVLEKTDSDEQKTMEFTFLFE